MEQSSSRIKAILDQALRIDEPAKRVAYLNQVCADAPELRQQVERFLQAKANDFGGQPAIPLGVTVDSHPGASSDEPNDFIVAPPVKADSMPVGETVGTCIGPYRLLQRLGEGGMGVVWVAQQTEPVKRRVALKVIKAGMDSAQVLHRFEAERQALALMDHTNIAKVLDAGTTREGRPYFVMELVKGIPITKYCDELHLTVRERLELFIPVCQAIQHAHQKGIIHRDVKPSNVLVAMQDGKPVPKVIDFGVAKALHQRLTEESLYTEIGQIVGTLEYMSPEQAELSALDVDTRADVYSLGVLLYELLTGATPLDPKQLRQAAYSEIVRQIREVEPPKPSTRLTQSKESLANLSAQRRTQPALLVKAVRGDLDWIVMRCLEKDRTRRYETANSLAGDVERYLKDEPVEACPPSTGYRLRKFVRRYRAVLVVAVGFVTLLILAAVVSTGLAVRATLAERRAESKAVEAITQTELAEAETKRADVAAEHAVDEANRARFLTALTSFHQGWSRAEQGDVAEGMLWMIEALERTPEAHPEFQSLVRANLPAWEDQLVRMKYRIPYETGTCLFCYSPDGKTVLARLSDGVSLQARDAATGRPISRPMTHEGLTSAVFSPDGRKVLSGGKDYTARLWDAATGQPIGSPMRHQNVVASVAFSPDSRKVLSGSHDKTARVWDAQTGQPLGPPMTHPGPVYVARFSPDGKIIVTGSLANAQRWDANTGQPLGPPLRHRWTVYAVAFSPDGTLFLTGSGRGEGEARLWDAATGQALGPPVPHNGNVYQVDFSPDGTIGLSISEDHRVRLWDSATGQLLGSPVRLLGQYPSLLPDGRSLLVTDEDKQISRVWTLGAGASLPRFFERDAGIRSGRTVTTAPILRRYAYAAFSRDGTRAVTQGVPWARLWDVATGQSIGAGLPQRWAGVGPVVFNPDGTKCALVSHNLEAGTWDCAIQLVDAKDSRLLAPAIHPIDTVKALAFSPDGSLLATGDFSDGVQLWNATTGMPVGPRLLQVNLVLALAFSPDGTKLAVGTTNDRGKNNSQVRLWDLTIHRPIGEPMRHHESVTYVAFSPDGRTLLSVSYDGLAFRWDAHTTRSLGPPIAHPTGFMGAVFRADSRAVLTGTQGGTVRLWDLYTGQPLSPPSNRPGTLTALALRPDGTAFAAGYSDGMTRLWDLATSRPIGPPLLHRSPVLAVAFSPDGRTLLSVDNSADIRTRTVPQPATESVSRLKLRVQALTGMELQSDQAITPLDAEAWRERFRQLPEPVGQALPVRDEVDALSQDEARTRAAELSGVPFAALWHLDRLIASRPDEGRLLVRRAFVQAAAGKLEAAERDLARALQLGPRDPCIDLLARQADAAMACERWEMAHWALQHAIAARPGNWWLYVDRAEALDHLGRKSERDQDRVRAVQHGADSLYLARTAREAERAGERGRADALRDLAIERLEARPSVHLLLELAANQVRRNRLEKAGDLLDGILKRPEATRPDHLDAGLLSLHLGVAKLYRAACAKLLASYGDAPNPMIANALAWQCVLGHDAVGDPAKVIRLAEAAVAGASTEQKPRALTTLGAALYRSGRPAEAVARLEEGIRTGNGEGIPQDWAFLAMAEHALGNSKAAHKWLRKLADRLPASFWEGLELKLLQGEAEALIEGSRPATLSSATSASTK